MPRFLRRASIPTSRARRRATVWVADHLGHGRVNASGALGRGYHSTEMRRLVTRCWLWIGAMLIGIDDSANGRRSRSLRTLRPKSASVQARRYRRIPIGVLAQSCGTPGLWLANRLATDFGFGSNATRAISTLGLTVVIVGWRRRLIGAPFVETDYSDLQGRWRRLKIGQWPVRPFRRDPLRGVNSTDCSVRVDLVVARCVLAGGHGHLRSRAFTPRLCGPKHTARDTATGSE